MIFKREKRVYKGPIMTRRDVLDKLDRIVLFLTEQRVGSRTQSEWENYNEGAWIVRNARKEVAHAHQTDTVGVG